MSDRTARSRESLAWLAGFWDGEGCVRAANTNTSKGHPIFHVSQAGPEGQALCQRVWDSCGIAGAVDGPYQAHNANWSPQYQARVSGFEHVQALVAMCWPWLSETKKAQAVAALRTFHETHPPRVLRTECGKGHEWNELNINYNPANNSWSCRVCRRKDPNRFRPNAKYRRNIRDGVKPPRAITTHAPQRVVWSPEHDVPPRSGVAGGLPVKTVREIRGLIAEGLPQEEIGARYGVSQSVVSRIKLGVTYKHVL